MGPSNERTAYHLSTGVIRNGNKRQTSGLLSGLILPAPATRTSRLGLLLLIPLLCEEVAVLHVARKSRQRLLLPYCRGCGGQKRGWYFPARSSHSLWKLISYQLPSVSSNFLNSCNSFHPWKVTVPAELILINSWTWLWGFVAGGRKTGDCEKSCTYPGGEKYSFIILKWQSLSSFD